MRGSAGPAGTAETGVTYAPAGVEDGQAGHPIRCSSKGPAARWLPFLLVCLVLCSIAGLIFYLCTPGTVLSDLGGMEKSHQDGTEIPPTTKKISVIKPRKPIAHLTGWDPPRSDGILLWDSVYRNAFMQDLDYKEGGLVVQKEGYYYVYSKVYFTEPRCSMFRHTVLWRTPRITSDLKLMESKRFHCQVSRQQRELMNSYLGGVFHLYNGDTLLVRAKNHTLIIDQSSYDNFFGAYMI
ncbi:hypothetical protein AAFF_G00184060 [Aldrovandia affinis]|uniref:THD domain-containing protein n=1 Tax=Aldrovandia affinis TaxID=143900 RepID=A0AAD7R094_9TELE|nr:hypothetical protein AAFF_G00184060 [Aldrovandia affinis]